MEKSMDKIVNLCKSRGYIYPGSEIYGGLANSWDYGPLGVEFKNNVKKAWMKKFIQENKYNVGLDAAILMNPETWVASGHVGGFSDPLIDCKECKTRHRADKLIEAYDPSVHSEGWSNEQTMSYIKEHNIVCPKCGKMNYTDIRVDGIEAKGLDENYNLIVDRTPKMNFLAKSTPELILKRIYEKSDDNLKQVYARILEKF